MTHVSSMRSLNCGFTNTRDGCVRSLCVFHCFQAAEMLPCPVPAGSAIVACVNYSAPSCTDLLGLGQPEQRPQLQLMPLKHGLLSGFDTRPWKALNVSSQEGQA